MSSRQRYLPQNVIGNVQSNRQIFLQRVTNDYRDKTEVRLHQQSGTTATGSGCHEHTGRAKLGQFSTIGPGFKASNLLTRSPIQLAAKAETVTIPVAACLVQSTTTRLRETRFAAGCVRLPSFSDLGSFATYAS